MVILVPAEGDLFRCDTCGMEMQCVVDCDCPDGNCIVLKCCDQDLRRLTLPKTDGAETASQ